MMQKVLKHSYLVVRIALVISVLLIAAFGFLSYTTAGANLVLQTAIKQLPQLKIAEIRGSLLGTLELSGVAWDAPGSSVSIEQLALSLQPGCWFRIEVCIDSLQLQYVELSMASSEPSANDSTPSELLQLPVPVSVKHISIKHFSLFQDGVISLAINHVDSGGRFYQSLLVSRLNVEGVQLYLPESAPQPTLSLQQQLQQLSAIQYMPIDLPALSIPLQASLPKISLRDMQVYSGEQIQYQLASFAAQVAITPDNLALKDIHLLAGQLALSGWLETDNHWQIQSKLVLTDPAGKLTVSANGKPERLTLKLNGQGRFSDIAVNGEAEVVASMLSTDLPLHLQAHFSQINLPENILLQDTSLVLKGDLQQFQLTANSTLQHDLLAQTAVDLDLSGNLKDISLNQIRLQSSQGEIELKGGLHLDSVPQLDISLAAKNIDTSSIVSGLDTELDLQSELSLSVVGEQFRVQGKKLLVSAPWQGSVATLTGKYGYSVEGLLALNDLVFTLGDNRIAGHVEKHPDDHLALLSQVELNQLNQLHPEMVGSVKAEIQVQGPMLRPQISVSGSGQKLRYQSYTLENFASEMTLAWSPQSPFKIEFRGEQLKVDDNLTLDLQLNSTGIAADHTIYFGLYSDWLQVESKMAGALSEERWSGEFRASEVTRNNITFALQSTPKLLLDWQKQTYTLSPACWQHQQAAAVCLEQLQWSDNMAKVGIEGKALPLIKWLEGNHRLVRKLKSDTLLDFSFTTTWAGGQFNALNYQANFTPAQWQLFDEEQLFFIKSLQLNARLKGKQILAESTLLSDELGTFVFKGQLPVAPDFSSVGVEEARLSTKIEQLKIAPFGYLVPQVEQLQGTINADISAKLNNDFVSFSGNADLTDGQVISRELGINIHDLSQTLLFDGQTVSSTGQFKMGSGVGTLQADVGWQEDWSVDMQLKGEALEYDDNLMVNLKVSPDIALSLSESLVKLSGVVNVPEASVKIKSLPESAQKPSSDIVFADNPNGNGNTGPKLEMDLALHVDPTKQKTVNLEAFGLTTALTGNLQLNGGTALTANGEVSLLDGTYKAYGQNLVIRQGDLLFNGPLEYPSLSLEAIRDPQLTSDNVIAGLRVEGAVRQPSVTVFSTPDMSQAQALSYLLSGKALGTKSDASQESVFANILLSYGLNKSEGTVSKLGKSFGVEDLSLAMEGQGDASKVAVSGTIAPNVKIAYGVGVFDAVSEVSLRYQLLPQLYLEAVSGLSNAFDIFYEFNYDPKPEPELKQDEE